MKKITTFAGITLLILGVFAALASSVMLASTDDPLVAGVNITTKAGDSTGLIQPSKELIAKREDDATKVLFGSLLVAVVGISLFFIGRSLNETKPRARAKVPEEEHELKNSNNESIANPNEIS